SRAPRRTEDVSLVVFARRQEWGGALVAPLSGRNRDISGSPTYSRGRPLTAAEIYSSIQLNDLADPHERPLRPGPGRRQGSRRAEATRADRAARSGAAHGRGPRRADGNERREHFPAPASPPGRRAGRGLARRAPRHLRPDEPPGPRALPRASRRS